MKYATSKLHISSYYFFIELSAVWYGEGQENY